MKKERLCDFEICAFVVMCQTRDNLEYWCVSLCLYARVCAMFQCDHCVRLCESVGGQ